MAIIVYPEDGWNSFITEVKADEIISTMTSDGVWLGMSTEDKEVLLVNSTLYIRAIADIEGACDFETAQAMVIQFDITSGGVLLSYLITVNKYDAVSVGSISVDYAEQRASTDAENIPGMIQGILRDCLIDTSSYGRAEGFEIV